MRFRGDAGDEHRGFDSNAAGGAKPAGGKQALLRRAWRSAAWIVSAPLRVFPREEIAKSASAIATVVGVLKRGPRPGPTVTVIDDRTFDLEAMAFRQGLSVSQLEALLRRRRRASARFAYLALGGLAVLWRLALSPDAWRVERGAARQSR